MEKRPRGRPPVPDEEKAVQRGVRFEAALWNKLTEMVPPRRRSEVVNDGLRRELLRLERQQKKQSASLLDT
jgi:hypothetical protein